LKYLTVKKAVMKRNSLILAIILLISMGFSVQSLNAQDKSKEDKEKEQKMQETIEAQKKAYLEQQKAQKDMQQSLEDQKVQLEQALKDAKIKVDDADKVMRVYETTRGDRQFYRGEPFVFTPGMDFNWHPMNGDAERTTWDFSKSVKESSFSRDYTLDVESTVNTVVMAVNGDCKAGEIRIKIIMPNGKTYSDILIDEFGNLNWRKSFSISDTENKDKTGAWKFDISASKATGYFKISLQTY
jgi:type II secretory pathway pseudopilin PulG